MTEQITRCPIWDPTAPEAPLVGASGFFDHSSRTWYVDDSPRVAGGYVLPEVVFSSSLKQLSEEEKARLTTWLIDQRGQGNKQPEITVDIVESIKVRSPLPVHERADRLLRFIAAETSPVGGLFDLRKPYPQIYAWSEATLEVEVGYLMAYLFKRGWLDSTPNSRIRDFGHHKIPVMVRVTVDGHSYIADQRVNVNFAQGFVAMWFDDSMNEAWEKGIKPALEMAGYEPSRIDRKEHLNKIDDEIIAEIRRSRLLVADFTHGDEGIRGGVYYEAGFAHGLNLPVIFTCRNDQIDKLHFDTNHYVHILWHDVEDLRKQLTNRILAVFGDGPRADNNL